MQCLKNGHIIAKFCQISCAGQTGRTGTDNCNFLTILLLAGAAGLIPFSLAQSATKRSSLPMETGSPLMPRTHCPSHWLSCGHTRPQTAGRAEDWLMIFECLRQNCLLLPAVMKSGILMETGHPSIHFGFFTVQAASMPLPLASSLLYPKHTSSKFVARTFGSCSLTGTLLQYVMPLFVTSAISASAVMGLSLFVMQGMRGPPRSYTLLLSS